MAPAKVEMKSIVNVLAVTAAIITSIKGDIVFQEDFEAGNLDQWSYQACPNGVTISTDVARSGTHSAKFTVNDGDTNAKCDQVPTENPRAQIVSNEELFKDGDEYFIAFSVYFPEGFPQPTNFFQLLELYGEPFGGSPTMGVDICEGNKICFERDETHNYDTPWKSEPIVVNQWRDITLHIKFSTDEGTGFVEIWDGGKLQQLSNGQTRINYATLHDGINWDGTPNSVFMNQYRSSDDSLGTVTIYEDALKVGTTFEEVQPPALPPAPARRNFRQFTA